MRKIALLLASIVVCGFIAVPAKAIDVTSSTEVTVTAIVGGTTTGGTTGGTTTGGTTTTGGGSSGGGSGGGYYVPTSITFSGRAYPLSRVVLLKDGQEAINTLAGPDAKFSFTISNLNTGTYTFSILSEDSHGRRSTLFTIPVSITYGVSAVISGIFLAPTIDIDKQAVKKGDSITIFGETAPGSEVTISVHSSQEIIKQIQSDASGAYFYTLNTAVLEYGKHNAQSKAEIVTTNETAPYGKVLSFTVGDQTIEKTGSCPDLRGDFNNDCKVNLIDFSILSYWYKKTGYPAGMDLSGNGKIDFADFSILAYYWTG